MRKRVLLIIAFLLVGAVVSYFAEVGPLGPKHLRIVNTEGNVVMHAVVYIRDANGQHDYGAAVSSGDGWTQIARGKCWPWTKLIVGAPGCEVVETNVPWGNEIVLPFGHRVTLAVPGAFALPDAGQTLEVELEPVGETKRWASVLGEFVATDKHWDVPWVDRDPWPELSVDPKTRSVSLFVPQIGAWQVRWRVMRYRAGSSPSVRSGSGFDSDTPVPIMIEKPGETVALPIPKEELADLMRKTDAG